MKLVFLTNFLNHHQKMLSDALYKKTNGDFWFIETKPLVKWRVDMGWENEYSEYVKTCYEHKIPEHEDTKESISLINGADVIITGSAPESLIKERIKSGKLIFRYAERPLKVKKPLMKAIRFLISTHIHNPRWKKIYMLCASAYTAGDYRKLGAFSKRTYKWGYFPETKYYESVDALIKDKNKSEILWCGRFINWKHAEDSIRVAARLKEAGYSFRLNIVGNGELENELADMIKENALENNVFLLGAMSAAQVREQMERAGIYLFTSDRQEGWGAVLNESMNSACAVVASYEIGAVPFLMKDNENGMVYEACNIDMLFEKVKYLLDNPDEQERMGTAAYHTIIDEWNGEVAAERFINLAQHILDGDKYPDLYKSGPCSRAEAIREKWSAH